MQGFVTGSSQPLSKARANAGRRLRRPKRLPTPAYRRHVPARAGTDGPPLQVGGHVVHPALEKRAEVLTALDLQRRLQVLGAHAAPDALVHVAA